METNMSPWVEIPSCGVSPPPPFVVVYFSSPQFDFGVIRAWRERSIAFPEIDVGRADTSDNTDDQSWPFKAAWCFIFACAVCFYTAPRLCLQASDVRRAVMSLRRPAPGSCFPSTFSHETLQPCVFLKKKKKRVRVSLKGISSRV